jgi:hypothetical protein
MKIAISSLLMGAGILAACATAPTPVGRSYVAAQVAVANAEKMPVYTHGNQELTVARQRLEASRLASLDGEAELAEMLAIESILSSDLAIAKTALGKTSAMNQEMQEQNKAMQQEMLRNKKVSP